MRFASEHSKLPRTDGVRVLAAAPEAKAGSVAPFAVHIAIENVRRAGYFTEKLAALRRCSGALVFEILRRRRLKSRNFL